MNSVSAPDVKRSARQASRSPAALFLARIGLTARGVIYILVGAVAVLVALGRSAREADQQGALHLLAGKSYGMVALWLLAIGFAGYALWRLSEAVFGVTGDRPGAGPRLKSLARAVIYAGLSYLTFTVISGTDRSQRRRQQDITASAMQHTAGRVLVGVVGLVIVACGIILVKGGYHGRAFSPAPFRPDGASLSVLGLGIVLSFSTFSGFEAASTMGEDSSTRRPTPATILLTMRKRCASSLKWTVVSSNRPNRSTKHCLWVLIRMSVTVGSFSSGSIGP